MALCQVYHYHVLLANVIRHVVKCIIENDVLLAPCQGHHDDVLLANVRHLIKGIIVSDVLLANVRHLVIDIMVMSC